MAGERAQAEPVAEAPRRAKRQADELAAGFASPAPRDEREPEPEPLTLATLFEIYGEEVTPTKAEYEALLAASMSMDWRFRVALVIAHETGHRIGSIRQLRWSGIDMEARIIRWRAENEKTGYEHRTPVTAEVLAVLEEARMQNPRG